MYLNPMRCLGNYVDSKPDSEQYYQHLTCISLSGEGKKRKLIFLICSRKWFAVRALGSVKILTVLLTKVHRVKAMFFPVVMYGCESWTTKKAECWRIGAFQLWYLEKTLESPLDCKEIQPVNPKEISPEYSLEGLMLKLKPNTLATWCEELTH